MLTLFSSLGVIMSLDDFYVASSGLAAMETTLYVYNKELFKDNAVSGKRRCSLKSSSRCWLLVKFLPVHVELSFRGRR